MKDGLNMRIKVLIICCMFCFWSQMIFALTEQELISIRDGFDARRDSVLASQVASPYPGVDVYVWNRQDFALSALYLNTQLPAANQAIIDACNALKNAPATYDEHFHWNGNLFYRIYKFFAHDSLYFPGRLTPAAQEAIYDIFWQWAKHKSKIKFTDHSQSDTWVYWGSENHDAQFRTTCYSAADILRNVPAYQNLTYDDGSSAAQQYQGWNSYYKEYFAQRAKKGLLVELGSATYSKYTLQGWYNFYDFAPDAELARLSGNLLDVWWADWALDQINSVRGGGKMRMYQDNNLSGTSDGAYAMAWFYFNKGTPNNKHPGVMCLATSTHRLPLVVMDIALDTAGKGAYDFYSRRPGLKLYNMDADGITGIDAATGGILRYTYATPAYILGTCMWDKRPALDWTAISSQNRWIGAIFAVHANARIFPQCDGLTVDEKNYNQHWSVQNKGTLIAQKLSTNSSAGDMRVFFSGSTTNMTISEENGWIFARMTNAFAAVRPAWGTYSWDDARWIRLSDAYAPVIMEVWQSSDFSNVFSLFKAAVLGQTINVDTNGVLTYTGLKDAGDFTFYTQSFNLPKINGTAINLTPDYTFQSPYLNEDWDSGIVTIAKDARSLTLDFNYDGQVSCQELTADRNGDCVVDIADLKELASSWLGSTASCLPSMPFVDNLPVAGLWHFDSTFVSGTNTFFPDDDSLNTARNNDAVIHSTGAPYVSLIDDGKFGKAAKFAASDTDVYLLLAGRWDDAWKGFSLRVWVRFADTGDVGGYIAHIYDRVSVLCSLTTATFYVTDGTDSVTITAPLAVADQWQYIEAVYDGQTISLKTQVRTTVAAGIGDISLADQKSVYIGSRKNKNRFVGQMDELRISTAAATGCDDFDTSVFDLADECCVNNLDLAVMAEQWF